jgi:SAM-dependent methyltransferase
MVAERETEPEHIYSYHMQHRPNLSSKETEQFWSQRYMDQSTGWDLGAPSPPIRQYIDQLQDKSRRILIPGAGNGYEAEYLFRSGFIHTHVLDISEYPLRNFQKRIPDFPSSQLLHDDFFELKDSFDLILEQTFFCSFPPTEKNRKGYVQKMHELLNPGGKLAGLWFDFPLVPQQSSPPYGGSRDEYLALFNPHFSVRTLERAHNSVPSRTGNELFGIFEKR